MGTRLREHALKLAMRLAKRLDRRQPDPAELGSATIQHILVVSCTAIGDTLMSTPAIRSLRLAYPHAHLTLLIHPAYRELFASLPGVNAMLGYRGGWKGFVRLALTLHRQSFDLAVILHGNEPQATPLAYLSGARWIFKLPNAGLQAQHALGRLYPLARQPVIHQQPLVVAHWHIHRPVSRCATGQGGSGQSLLDTVPEILPAQLWFAVAQ
jgi:hypothetical protein